MRHFFRIFPSALLVAGLVLPAVVSAKPSFKDVTATVTNGELRTVERVGFYGGLLVCFVEVGLGSGDTSYLITADATADYECINSGGNNPQADNKGSVAGPVSAAGTFTATRSGQVEACLPVAPLEPGSFINCTPGMTLVLRAVSYTNVVLTDTTNGLSIAIPGTFSKTFPTP